MEALAIRLEAIASRLCGVRKQSEAAKASGCRRRRSFALSEPDLTAVVTAVHEHGTTCQKRAATTNSHIPKGECWHVVELNRGSAGSGSAKFDLPALPLILTQALPVFLQPPFCFCLL